MEASPTQLLAIIGSQRVETLLLAAENKRLKKAIEQGCQRPCCQEGMTVEDQKQLSRDMGEPT